MNMHPMTALQLSCSARQKEKNSSLLDCLDCLTQILKTHSQNNLGQQAKQFDRVAALSRPREGPDGRTP